MDPNENSSLLLSTTGELYALITAPEAAAGGG
jgi:hypothetical protein